MQISIVNCIGCASLNTVAYAVCCIASTRAECAGVWLPRRASGSRARYRARSSLSGGVRRSIPGKPPWRPLADGRRQAARQAARRACALRRNLGHERSAAGACAVAPRCGDLESRYGLTANVEISDPRALSVNVRLTDLA